MTNAFFLNSSISRIYIYILSYVVGLFTTCEPHCSQKSRQGRNRYGFNRRRRMEINKTCAGDKGIKLE